MAYNLQPLIQILEQILHPRDHGRPNWVLDPRKKPNVELLLAQANFLNEIFENPSAVTSHAIRSLETRIRDAACRAQDVLQSHLADQLLSQTEIGRIFISPPSLRQEFLDFGFQRIVDELGNIMDRTESSFGIASSASQLIKEDLNQPKNVGISQDLNQLKGRLVMPEKSELEIIPIVGMGGIGKTTLARTLYDSKNIGRSRWFDTRAWIVISQNYNVRKILLGILECVIGNLSVEMTKDDNDKLGLYLHKHLCGRRYLIVLDDMWSSEAWDCVKKFFPDQKKGSRILVTTRELSVANSVAGNSEHHLMRCLNDKESWKLLCRKLFPGESCPSELKEVGKSIAKSCGGLPLAIHTVGGVLSRLDKTKETWIQVAQDVHSSMPKDHKQLQNILSLSYSHLPNHLKPCFLYMGAFPENCEIRASKVIKLWVAEGFIKSNPDNSFEGTAQAYLNELVERNLLLVQRQETKRRVKSYIMHDLLRDLCIRKGREEKFFHVFNDSTKELGLEDMRQRRLRAHASYSNIESLERSRKATLPQSFLLFARHYDANHTLVPLLDCMRDTSMQLVKVLDILAAKNVTLPKAMNRLVNLRYLAACISVQSNIPPSISSLCSLQTLVFRLESGHDPFVVKVQELFDIPQLRHINFKRAYPLFILGDGERIALQEELQTLSTVFIDDSFTRILQAVPNLKKLGICKCDDASIRAIIDLRCLRKLEILRCSTGSGLKADYLESLILPASLKKLTLFKCALPQGFLYEIGCLPNVEVLKVQDSFFECSNRTWKPTKGGFQQLKLLLLESFSMKEWIADEAHYYPRLEHLVIRDCVYLEKIPSGIGEINTLKIIELHGRNKPSVTKSAMEIQEDKNQFGDDDFQVLINNTRGEAEANEPQIQKFGEDEPEEEEVGEEDAKENREKHEEVAEESGAKDGESGAIEKEREAESKGHEGLLKFDLEQTELEILNTAKLISIGGFLTCEAEPSSSAVQGGNELSLQDSVQSSAFQIMLSMGFSYGRVIDAHNICGDDVNSMLDHLIGKQQ